MPSRRFVLLACLALLPGTVSAADLAIAIRADYPGGNVLVVENTGGTVQLAPDLRGGKPWFYWNFEARASQLGRATFVFAGSPIIGVRGPAFSLDDGRSWQWLGADHATYAARGKVPADELRETFYYDFTAEHLTVRFAVAIPYLQADLDAFLREHAANPHLREHPLTKTSQGTPVEMLQIGQPGPGIRPMLITARHHACESLASYVMEGFLREALSESAAGRAFRKKHVLYAVPLVDKDGVQAGDQGKNRSPHDHNRDYGPMPIYPVVAAIQDLGEAQDVCFALDLHCPALRGDIHEAFHFLGLGVPHVKENLNEFIAWMKEERPQGVMAPLNLLADAAKPGAANEAIYSHHFALRKGAMFAATLEIPYTQPKTPLDAAMARAYGESMVKAWTRTKFLPANVASNSTAEARGAEAQAALVAFRTEFVKFYRSKPAGADAMAARYLDDPAASPVFRVEANNLMTVQRLRQKRIAEAREHNEAARNDPHATTLQRNTALLLQVQIASLDPESMSCTVEEAMHEFLQLPYPAAEQTAKAWEYAGAFYEARQDYAEAVAAAKRQLPAAAAYEKGRVLNRIAMLHDLRQQPDAAAATRAESIALLSTQLQPKPARSVFGAMMVQDLFEAVTKLPTSTLAEKQAAAALVLEHDIVPAAMKEKVRAAIAELEAR